MRLIFSLVLLLGLGLSGGAVYLARDYVGAYQAELQKRDAALAQVVPTTEVLVATRALRYGERLLAADLRAVRWPADAVPEGAFTELSAVLPEGDAKPRTVLRAMEKDEVVLALKVTDPGEDAGVSARLGRGMRAFAIRVDVASGVSGFLRPGDRVDVYWSGPIPSGDGGTREVTRLIDTGIGVLAIDQTADGDMADPTVARTVTVEGSPHQVAAFAQAQSTGRLSLSLVGAGDDTVAEAVQVDQRSLLDLEERRVVEVEAPRVCTIRTRRGGEVLEVPIPCRTN